MMNDQIISAEDVQEEQLVVGEGAENDTDIETLDGEVSLAETELTEEEKAEFDEEQQFALKILKRAASLKAVRINRETFLRTELAKRCPSDQVEKAIQTTPQQAGIPLSTMDAVADSAIALETRKVAGLSALAGIPGGLAMFGTIPADIVNYFAHVLRVEQKLAYAYGWQSFMEEDDEIDDETMTKLIVFLGIIMQVGGMNVSLTNFAFKTAMVGVAKSIEKQALTKTAWYPVLKKVLAVLGVKLTKKSFAEVAAKGVPIAGGLISGGITFATFKPGSISLKKHLRLLPQATGVPMTEEEVVALLNAEEEREKKEREEKLQAAKEAALEAGGKARDVAVDLGGKAFDAAKVGAGFAKEKAGVFAASAGKALGGLAAKLAEKRKASETAPTDVLENQLRTLKGLFDEGILSQEEFDAKKRQLLGL